MNSNEAWTRRRFLLLLGTSSTISFFSGCMGPTLRLAGQSPTQHNPTVLIPTNDDAPDGANSYFHQFELNGNLDRKIEVPLYNGHGTSVNPRNPSQAFVMDQFGPYACEIDLKNNRLVRSISLKSENRQFYGHGVFSPDGEFIYDTEIILPGKEGIIAVRRTSDFKKVDEIPSFGTLPHEIAFYNSESIVAVANQGTLNLDWDKPHESSVTLVDVKTKKLLRKTSLGKIGSASHLRVLKSGDIFVGCSLFRNRRDEKGNLIRKQMAQAKDDKKLLRLRLDLQEPVHTPCAWINADGSVKVLDPPELKGRMKNALSIAVGKNEQVVGLTHPKSNLITFWNGTNGDFIKGIDTFPYFPAGLIYVDSVKSFVVSTSRALLFVDAERLELKTKPIATPIVFTGGHASFIDAAAAT